MAHPARSARSTAPKIQEPKAGGVAAATYRMAIVFAGLPAAIVLPRPTGSPAVPSS